MAKLKPISISFDEYQLSKNYFEFNVNKKEVESAIYNILFNRKYYQMYYEIIIKYLLHTDEACQQGQGSLKVKAHLQKLSDEQLHFQ